MNYHSNYCLTWLTEDEADEDWMSEAQTPHKFYCNNKIELLKRYRQALTEQGYDFEVYAWIRNQYCLTNIKLEE